MCDKCKDGEICVDGLLDGSDSVMPENVDDVATSKEYVPRSWPQPYEFARNFRHNAEEFMVLVGRHDLDSDDYESIVVNMSVQLMDYILYHVRSGSCRNDDAAISVLFEKAGQILDIKCAGCGVILKTVEIG